MKILPRSFHHFNDPVGASWGIFLADEANKSSIRCINWNPLGTLVASGASDRTLRVWNPDRPNVRYSTELKGHEAGIEKVAFNPVKDAELCSFSADGVVRIWDVRTKTCTNEVKGLGSAVSLAWHPDGESIIAGNKVGRRCQLIPGPWLRYLDGQSVHNRSNTAETGGRASTVCPNE